VEHLAEHDPLDLGDLIEDLGAEVRERAPEPGELLADFLAGLEPHPGIDRKRPLSGIGCPSGAR
jgi:hypothetical protein